MEDTPADPLSATPLPPPPVRRVPPPGHLWGRVRQWTGELITVFIGVYAAFALNNYQLHRQERQRRDQILAWAQGEYGGSLQAFADGYSIEQSRADEFERRTKAGEMPPLHRIHFVSDYNPTDFTSMLQSGGGFDLLEIETVRDLRAVEGTLRQIIEINRYGEQLSASLILPNLDRPPSFFYDADTKQLRPNYDWYSEYLEDDARLRHRLQSELVRLQEQLRTERQRNR